MAPLDHTQRKALLATYRQPVLRTSLAQLTTSVGSFVGSWVLMWLTLRVSYWITLALAIPAAGFLVRIFILQHDCGHRSFFKSKNANDTVGILLGVLTFTPYWSWRKLHAVHHATSGDLDRRGTGDIFTLTVDEYRRRSRLGRVWYRLFRNPLVTFGIGAFLHFVVFQRFAYYLPRSWKRERRSVYWTNAALLACFLGMWSLVGLKTLVMIHLPIMIIASSVGVWLFYVQHQYERTYWEHSDDWDYVDAGMEGSSYYQLPKPLQWITANIGLHHIHHVDSMIPNYRLQACLDEVPQMQHATRLTLWRSLSCASLKLWDEERQRLVGFKDIRGRAATSG